MDGSIKERTKGVQKIVLIAAGIFAIYFVICICMAGIGKGFSFLWLALSVLCFMAGMVLRYLSATGRELPTVARLIVLIGMATALVLILIIWVPIIRYGRQTHRTEAVDYVIVLGARINGTTVSRSLAKRLDTAYDYLMEHKDAIALVSGGQGTDEQITEAEAMKRYLMEKGLQEERIIKEEASTNTDENIAYCRALIGDQQASVAIVTNSFHLYRAVKIGKKQGLQKVYGIAAPTNKVMALNYYAREGLAVVSYKLRGRI